MTGVELRYVFEVEAGPDYRVPVPAKWRARAGWSADVIGLFALRTRSGEGRIVLNDDTCLVARANSLILCEWRRVRRYYCSGSKWEFWFIEFTADGLMHIPLNVPVRLPPGLNDETMFRQMLREMESPRHIQRCTASSRMLLLLYECCQRYREQTRDLNAERIEQLILKIQESLGRPWTVTAMAKSAGMSVAWLRREFHRFTGNSPIKLYNDLRLARAELLLHTTPLTIGEIAGRLGYSSPYHFSKAFKQHYGLPPSAARA